MILANGDDLHLIFSELGMRLVAQEAQYISQTSEAAYLTCIESLSEKITEYNILNNTKRNKMSGNLI